MKLSDQWDDRGGVTEGYRRAGTSTFKDPVIRESSSGESGRV